MKNGIHPDYKKTTIKCVCGNEIETGSVVDNITVEICNHCHPFYTGQQKIVLLKLVVVLNNLTNVTAKKTNLLVNVKFYLNNSPFYKRGLLLYKLK